MIKVNNVNDLKKVFVYSVECGLDMTFLIKDNNDEEVLYHEMTIQKIDSKYCTIVKGFDEAIDYISMIEMYTELIDAYNLK